MRHFSGLLVSLCVLLVASMAAAQDPDIGAAREAVCCGANCCLIDGVCLSRGDLNPANNCEECNPSVAGQTAWSAIPGCTPTDAGPAPVDAGPPVVDAGSTDAGSTGTDAGPAPTMDSGTTSGTDAGTTPPADGGCAASPSPRGRGALALGLVAFAALAFTRRRR